MVKIRYSLAGRSGQRIFRIIVIDSKKKRESKSYLEHLGFYNPQNKACKVNEERLEFWVQRGAQVTNSVSRLLNKKKLFK